MKFKHIYQSSWLGDVINKHTLNNTINHTFVEMGVGNIIDKNYLKNKHLYDGKAWDNLPNIGSNTIELLQCGWRGFYIDPEQSFIEQAARLAPDVTKITTACYGCGDTYETKALGDGESFRCNTVYLKEENGWVGNLCQIKPTTDIFVEIGVPAVVDLYSIDVEGYEEELLRGLDQTKFEAKTLIIEHNHTGLDKVSHLLPKYTLVMHDDLNAFFINNRYIK